MDDDYGYPDLRKPPCGIYDFDRISAASFDQLGVGRNAQINVTPVERTTRGFQVVWPQWMIRNFFAL